MKVFGINIGIILALILVITWTFWCTSSQIVCNSNECVISNFNMVNLKISEKKLLPEKILGFDCVNYRHYATKASYDDYHIVVFSDKSKYKIPKSFGNNVDNAQKQVDMLQRQFETKPLKLYLRF